MRAAKKSNRVRAHTSLGKVQRSARRRRYAQGSTRKIAQVDGLGALQVGFLEPAALDQVSANLVFDSGRGLRLPVA